MAGLPEARPCACCGVPWAAFGYSRKNPKALPPRMRTVMWVCGRPECKARAENWKARADAALNHITPRAKVAPAPHEAQAALF